MLNRFRPRRFTLLGVPLLLVAGFLVSVCFTGDGTLLGASCANAAVQARPCTPSTVTVPGPTTTVTSTVISTTAPPPTTTTTGWAATLHDPAPPGSFWTKTIDQLGVTVDPNSAAMISAWRAAVGAGPGEINLRKWNVATIMATGSNPTYTLEATCSWTCNLGRWGDTPIPTGAKASPDTDAHLSVLASSGRAWEIDQLEYNTVLPGTYWAECGDTFDYATETLIAPICGATDANIPNIVTALNPYEIAADTIDHPLSFASSGRNGPRRCPSTGGTSNTSAGLPNGSLLRLDPALDVSGLPAWERAIAHALQRYGMYMSDGTTGLDLSAEGRYNAAGDPWTEQLGWTATYQYFGPEFPWDRMQLMTPPC